MTQLDYRELLIKYMQLIISFEGMTYLDWGKEIISMQHPTFTDEEAQELARLSDKARSPVLVPLGSPESFKP